MTLVTVHDDLENKMWTEYLDIVDGFDKRLTDRWKDDTKGVLVFVSSHLRFPIFITMTTRETALFSSTVASFIIASFPQLSPNTGTQTVFLLQQLSQQFANFPNGTLVQPGSFQSVPLAPSPSPTASIICVNILWVLSFLLSTTSALFATLMQQWGRIYIGLPQSQSVPSDRARVRSFLFLGTKKYYMDAAVEIAPTLLHLAVFLFYVGLVVFFFTINNTVAIAILISVGLFGLAYFTPTILPCLDHSCPYSTPLSRPWWYLWHTSHSLVAFFLRLLFRLLHNCLVPYNPGDATSFIQRILTRLLDTIDNIAEKHGGRLKDGFRETVVKYARRAPQDTDVKALTWMFQLPAMAERGKFQNFVASIPSKTIVQLFEQDNSFDHDKIGFRHHLSALLRTSSAPDTAELTDEQAKEIRNGRSVCLNAVHHIARESIASRSLSPSLLNDMRLRFANMALMRPLWANDDPAIRVTARSICALFARQLLRMRQIEAGELSWLQDVMGRPSSIIFNALRVNDLAAVDGMNVDSFVNGVLSQQAEVIPDAQVAFSRETLKVLRNAESHTSLHADTFEDWLSSLILRIELEEDYQNRDNVVDNLRRMSSSTTAGPQSQASGT